MAKRRYTDYCTFCGKHQHDVRCLVAAPDSAICNKCIEDCVGIMRKEGVEPFVSWTAVILPFPLKDRAHGRRARNPRDTPPDTAA